MSPSPSKTEDPSSSPTSPSRTTVSPLFMSPQSSTSPEQAPLLSTQHLDGSPSQLPAVPDPSWSTDEPVSPLDPGPSESGGTPSTKGGVKLSKAGLRAVVGTGFRSACRLLASFAADEEERELGLWKPTPDEVADIAEPAANIVYRRLPDDAKSGDVVDLIGIGMAIVGYVGKNLQQRAVIRTNRRLQAAQGIDVTVDATNAPAPGGGY